MSYDSKKMSKDKPNHKTCFWKIFIQLTNRLLSIFKNRFSTHKHMHEYTRERTRIVNHFSVHSRTFLIHINECLWSLVTTKCTWNSHILNGYFSERKEGNCTRASFGGCWNFVGDNPGEKSCDKSKYLEPNREIVCKARVHAKIKKEKWNSCLCIHSLDVFAADECLRNILKVFDLSTKITWFLSHPEIQLVEFCQNRW